MRKYLVAAVLIGAFATPALAVDTGGGHYFVGLDTSSHTCSVVTEMAAGMKMMESMIPRRPQRRLWPTMESAKARDQFWAGLAPALFARRVG